MHCINILHGHTGSVLCLQYDERVIITGSSDSTIRSAIVTSLHLYITSKMQTGTYKLFTIQLRHFNFAISFVFLSCKCFYSLLASLIFYRVWDVNTGQMMNTLVHHCEAVLHLRFNDCTMVTCSKVWNILFYNNSPLLSFHFLSRIAP